LPRWLHEYCGIPFTPVKKIFFGGLTLSSIFLVFLPFIITDDQFAQIKMNVINLQIIIWIMYFIKISIIYFIVRNIKKVETKEKKLLLKTIAIFMLLFFPIWILSFFIEFYYYPLLDLLNSSYLQYLIWNIIFIVFFGKNIFLTPNLPLQNEITDSFLKKYGITQREKEIILLIARGLANKQIAFELKISNVTIKNHIYNIYKKTGAQSKVELINLISTGSHSHNQILSI
jgi:DNA-binding CsgD family transcriptional regulator